MVQKYLLGKTMFDKLSREFELLFGFRAVCTKFMAPSYHENLELGVLVKEMIKLEIPTAN